MLVSQNILTQNRIDQKKKKKKSVNFKILSLKKSLPEQLLH